MKKLLFTVMVAQFFAMHVYGMDVEKVGLLEFCNVPEEIRTSIEHLPIELNHSIVSIYASYKQLLYEKKRFMHDDEVISAYFNKKETELVIGSDDEVVKIWDMATTQELFTVKRNHQIVSTWLNSEETHLWVLDGCSLAVIDRKTKAEKVLPVHMKEEEYIQKVFFVRDEDGLYIIVYKNDKMVRMLNRETGAELWCVPHEGIMHTPILNKEGSCLFTTLDNGTITKWNTKTAQALLQVNHGARVSRICLNDSETLLMTVSSWNNTTRIWDTEIGMHLLCLPHVGRFLYEDHSKTLLITTDTTTPDHFLQVWDISSGAAELLCVPYEGRVDQAFLNRDGTKLIICLSSALAQIYDIATQKKLLEVRSESSTRSVRLNKDETQLIVVSGCSVRIWDIQTGRALATVGHDSWVNGLCQNKNETLLVTLSCDKTARIWQRYDYSLKQVLLHKLLYTWILLEKPRKTITSDALLLSAVSEQLYIDQEDLVSVWNTFPDKVKSTIWIRLSQLIKKHGKK